MDISDSIRIGGWVIGHGNTLLINDSIVVAIYSGVHTHAEYVLMICGHDAWSDVGPPWNHGAVFIVDGHGGENASCTNLEFDATGLVKNPSEDVFIIGYGANHLDDELAVANYRGGVGAVVCVFMEQAGILLMETDDILQQNWITFGICPVPIEILDVTKAIAAKGQLVGGISKANIADIESLFSMIRSTRV